MTDKLNRPLRSFYKMHGLGNDFVIFDGRIDRLDLSEAQVRHLANRNRGIGCDQIITLWPSEKADVYMRIQNADGSEVGACGNATRCVGDIVLTESQKDTVTIETKTGLLHARREGTLIRVDMGTPQRHWREIPLSHEMDTDHLDFSVGPLSDPVAVNMGNPHVVFFVDNITDIDLTKWGPEIENHPLFPERVNVSIVQNMGRDKLRHRVWERGAGITEACGSAACAVVVAATVRAIINRKTAIQLDGGILTLEWDPQDHIQMTGEATFVFEGQIDLAHIK